MSILDPLKEVIGKWRDGVDWHSGASMSVAPMFDRRNCAHEVEALIPEMEAKITATVENAVTTERKVWQGRDSEKYKQALMDKVVASAQRVEKLEAEIAALTEKMATADVHDAEVRERALEDLATAIALRLCEREPHDNAWDEQKNLVIEVTRALKGSR